MSIFAVKTSALRAFALLSMIALSGVIGLNDARAEIVSIEDALSERSIGAPDAPVTLNEFASLTCPHCARFHAETLPDIKKNYVDTGKVRIVFHDFPLDNLAFAAAMIARCSGRERHFELYDRLFQTQDTWAQADQPRDVLMTIARFSGLSSEDVNQCLQSDELAQGIQKTAAAAQQQFDINSTPTFILEGEKIEGTLPYADFKIKLDQALAAKGVQGTD